MNINCNPNCKYDTEGVECFTACRSSLYWSNKKLTRPIFAPECFSIDFRVWLVNIPTGSGVGSSLGGLRKAICVISEKGWKPRISGSSGNSCETNNPPCKVYSQVFMAHQCLLHWDFGKLLLCCYHYMLIKSMAASALSLLDIYRQKCQHLE